MFLNASPLWCGISSLVDNSHLSVSDSVQAFHARSCRSDELRDLLFMVVDHLGDILF